MILFEPDNKQGYRFPTQILKAKINCVNYAIDNVRVHELEFYNKKKEKFDIYKEQKCSFRK